jgi:palmitoyltransferase
MDHHCPFLANCVGFSNYKFFVLVLLWTFLLAVDMAACGAFHIYDRVKDQPQPYVLDYFIVSFTAVAIILILLLGPFTITHLKLVLRNSTTLEHLEKHSAKNNPYNLGWYKNICQVFGSNPLLWLIPIRTSQGDGVVFPSVTEASSLLLHT